MSDEMPDWSTLVDAHTLADRLHKPTERAPLQIVDCRAVLTDPSAGERLWREARLPGACHASLDRDLSDLRLPQAGRHPLPSATDFAKTIARWNIGPRTQVVAYDAGDGAMAAARLWWLLRVLGHRRVAVLDGGYARWNALDLPLERGVPIDRDGDPTALAPVAYAGSLPFLAHQLVRTPEIQARLGDRPGWLVDARASARFRGEVEPLDPVAGHIPGAVNRPYSENLRADGRWRPAAELAAAFRSLTGDRDPADVVLMCGSGVTACHHLLAMEHAGLHGARVYADSWSGWIEDRTRPVQLGD